MIGRSTLLAFSMLALLGATAPLSALDPDKRLHHFVRDQWSIEDGLPQASVQAITQDRTGYVWVGTQAGVARFDGVSFRNFTPESAPALPGMLVQSLLPLDDGSVLIGTHRGLARHHGGVLERIGSRDDPGLRTGVDIHALAETPGGSIFVATGSGLMRYREGMLESVRALTDVPTLALLAVDDALWVGTVGAALRLQDGVITRLSLGADDADVAVVALASEGGRLWAGTQRGLFRFDGGVWRRFGERAELASLPIDTLMVDSRGSLWAGTVAGLARLRDGHLHEFAGSGDAGALPSVRALFQDREGNLWVGSQWQALSRLWDGYVRRYSRPEGLHMVVVWSLARDDSGRLWTGTGDGVAILEDGRFRPLLRGSELPHPDAYTLLVEGERVWIGTRGGLALYEDGQVRRPAHLEAIGNAQINSVVRDGRGDLWFGTSAGLFRERHEALVRFGSEQGLSDPRVRALRALPDGSLAVGSQRGLFRIENETVQALSDGSVMPADVDVTALHLLDDGLMVVGTLEEGLFVGDGQRWLDVAAIDGIPANSPFFITHDAQDHLWVAGMRGVYRLALSSLRARLRGESTALRAEVVLSERGDHRGGQKVHCCNGAGNAKGLIHDDVLWLPTRDGVIALPARDLRPETVAPTPVVEGLRSGATWHDGTAPDPLELPASSRDVGIEFTALGFRDPSSIQIRYRLRGYDERWHDLADTTRRSVSYTNLPPRPYVFEVSAANGSGVWAPIPAALEFRVTPWWHETLWFRILVAAVLLALFALVLRRRVARHVRREQALERLVRQRTAALHEANRRLEEVSVRDSLTGVHNRRFLLEQLPADIAHFHRCHPDCDGDGNVMLFALLDIDEFKRINDGHGHHVGDLILQQFAELLQHQVRSGDYVVRWGGEEFLLVLRPMPGDESEGVAERIRSAVASHPFDIGGDRQLRVTCSIGAVEYPRFDDSDTCFGWEQMVVLADFAMYQVKHGGRNGWALLRPTANTRRASLLEDLAQVGPAMIAAGELQLCRSKGLVLDAAEPAEADVEPQRRRRA